MGTLVERDVHSTPSPAVVEQIMRWALIDRAETWNRGEESTAAVQAAEFGSSHEFASALAALAAHDGPGSPAAAAQAAVWGNGDALAAALACSGDLLSLYRGAAQRGTDRDSAEIASADGLRVSAEAIDPGARYETRIHISHTPTHDEVLASGAVSAGSAPEAIDVAITREHALGGLDQADLARLRTQLDRARRLEALTGATAHHTTTPSPTPSRWEALADRIDPALRTAPGWGQLTTTLEQAASEGYDVEANLPRLAAHAALPPADAASELQYRVMDACPAAVPPAPSVAQINGAEPNPSGPQREAAERAIARAPATDRAPTVGR
jgi:hypothetical protein